MLCRTRSIPQIACTLIVLLAGPAIAKDILVSTPVQYEDAVREAQTSRSCLAVRGLPTRRSF